MMYRGWGWGYGMGWGGGIFMALVCIVFIGLVIWGIVMLARHGHMTEHHSLTNKTPIDIAKERYAKGEITKEQFDQIKKDLS